MTSTEKPNYKDTLNLPETSFSIRAQSAEKEPLFRDEWSRQGILDRFFTPAKDATFVLHDGPPYANGAIHMGHALNKVLKDIIIRAKRMAGHTVSFLPGWDCHGLPIELKVLAQLGIQEISDRVSFKKECRTYAQGWKEKQCEGFQQLGVFSEWDTPYLTMTPTYQASILRAFGTLVRDGYISRKGKTVSWCFSCQTVLSTAEIEYKDRKDPSVFIMFPLMDQSAFPVAGVAQVGMLAWTTTPWTLPLNRALMVHPDTEYALLQIDTDRAVFVGEKLVDRLAMEFGIEPVVLDRIHSSKFAGMTAAHPFDENYSVPVLFDDSVLLNDGTACVHSAPGCGPEDYIFGLKNNLEIYSPLNPDGTYSNEIIPAEIAGEKITDGQWWVLKQLKEKNLLVHKSSLTHSYPHCWRCHNGLMFRATDQWFCDLNKNDLSKKAVAALGSLSFIPEWGRNRLEAFVSNRPEWCISRQRVWGVPIPGLFNTADDTVVLDADFVAAVADHVAEHGTEWWDAVSIAELRSLGMLPEALQQVADEHIVKEMDILDVWFDSGVSHFAVMKEREGRDEQVDLYLEGSDQHRGWFQSSLLTSLILADRAPTKSILTHGFVVDENGHKMSKSLGNTIDPVDVLNQYGADALRLWVASTDYERDIVISQTVLKNIAEVYRKIRNTCRFLLLNVYDFDAARDAVDYDDLLLLDRMAIDRAEHLNGIIQKDFEQYSFAHVVSTITHYCTVELSATYLDMIKGRLYVDMPQSHSRRSAQTALHRIITILMRLLTPLMPYTMEDVARSLPKSMQLAESIQLSQFIPITQRPESDEWVAARSVRSVILKAIEEVRATGELKHSLEAQVTVYFDPKQSITQLWEELCAQHSGTEESFVKEWCIVSQYTRAHSVEGLGETAENGVYVKVSHAAGDKCPRCWNWSITDHVDKLCATCEVVVQKLRCSV